MTPQIYTLSEMEAVVSEPNFATKLIDAIKDGFVSYSQGKFNACPIQTMGAPPMAPFAANRKEGDGEYAAQTCVKSGYITGASHYVIKVASGGHPFPNSGLMQLYSQQTGRLEAILLDEGILTELRTAAVGAVAAQLLAPDLPKNGWIGILGTGVQARYQLRYLSHVTQCRNVNVWGRTRDNVDKFIVDMWKRKVGM
jgi:ornithine cyclodeaminase